MALAYCYSGQREKALETVDTYLNIFQIDNFMLFNSMRIYISLGKNEKVIELFDKNLSNKSINDLSDSFLGYLGIAYFKTGKKEQSSAFLDVLAAKTLKPAVGSPYYYEAAIFTGMGETEKALQSLQKAYSDHEVEMTWLKVDPLFLSLHDDQRFESLLRNVGFH